MDILDILVPLEYQADQEFKEPLVLQVELVQLVGLAQLEPEVKKDHAVILVVPLWVSRTKLDSFGFQKSIYLKYINFMGLTFMQQTT